MKCPYKVEESGKFPYGCSYDANKVHGGSPLPQCGIPVTLMKAQHCSEKLKIKICRNCDGKGYIEIKQEEKLSKVGSFRVSDWFPITVFQRENGDYTLTSGYKFSSQQIDKMYTLIKSKKKPKFTTKELCALFPNLSRQKVYYALVVLTVKGLLLHRWGVWELC